MTKKKNRKAEKNLQKHSDSFFKRNAYPLIILVFSCLLYANSVTNDYNLDDELVTRNHKLTSQGFGAIPQIFTLPYYSDAMGYAFDYRPVAHTSFAIEHQLFGDSPAVSHFFNIAFYSLLCFVLYLVLINLPGISPLFAFGASVLFITHPLHTEVVCSIKNRDEIFSLLFSLLALLAALKYQLSFSLKWLPVIFFSFLLSLLSKYSGVSFAIIIPLTLIIFFKTPVRKVAIINLLFAAPVFILCQQIDLWSQIRFTVFVFFTPFLFYLPAAVGRKILNTSWNFITQLVYFSFTPEQKGESISTSDGKQNAVSVEIVLVTIQGIFRIQPLLVALIITWIIAMSFLAQQKVSIGIGLVILAFLSIVLKREAVRFWAIVGFATMLFILSIMFSAKHVISEYSFCLIGIYLALVWHQRRVQYDKILKISLLLPVVVSLMAAIYSTGQIGMFIAYPLLLLCWKFPRTKVAMIVIVLLYGCTIFGEIPGFMVQPNYENMRNVVVVLTQTFVFLLFLCKNAEVKNSLYYVIVLSLIYGSVVLADLPYFYNSSASKAHTAIVNIDAAKKISAPSASVPNSYTKAVQLFNMNPDRRIDFVESPVDLYAPLYIRIGTASIVFLHYLKKLLVPYPLSFYYGYRYIEPTNVLSLFALLSLTVHFGLLVIGIIFFNKYQVLSWAILVYLLSVFAVSNFVQPIAGTVADRFAFIPSFAFCVAVIWLVFKLFKVKPESSENNFRVLPSGSKVILAGILLLYSGITFSRNRDWKDDLTLFRKDISAVEESAQAHNLLGIHLINHAFTLNNEPAEQKKLREEAITHFKKAVEIYPAFFNVTYDLGRSYTLVNMPDSAIFYFQKALRLNSKYIEIHLHLGNLYFSQGKYTEAIPYFERIVKERPYEYVGYDKLSFVYFKLEKFDKSLETNKLAVSSMPTLATPLINIGQTYLGTNQMDSAKIYLEKALILEPNNSFIKQLLGQAGKSKL